jgi:CDP-glycerol glycerophosphotransferase
VLIVDFENLYPDGTTSPSGGAKYLSGPETSTLADHPALIHLTMTAWSKVFRRDFLCGLGVSFGSVGPAPHEDVPVTATALLTAKTIGVLDRVCYRYRRARRGSFLAVASNDNFNIFNSYRQIFNLLSERSWVPALSQPVRAAVFERAIWHYTTLLPLVPRPRRQEFFHRMSVDFRRWRPAGFSFPPGLRGLKFRLVARDAYLTYSLLDPVNRLRVALRSK